MLGQEDPMWRLQQRACRTRLASRKVLEGLIEGERGKGKWFVLSRQ